jgi:hypothetical protein
MGSADHQTNFVRNAARPAVLKSQPWVSLSHRMDAATIAQSGADRGFANTHLAS